MTRKEISSGSMRGACPVPGEGLSPTAAERLRSGWYLGSSSPKGVRCLQVLPGE